jgi:hypothetical protein
MPGGTSFSATRNARVSSGRPHVTEEMSGANWHAGGQSREEQVVSVDRCILVRYIARFKR